tara:strand:+ start:223 stop:564 length:342 start_codon:yes stop_codon:yes gene_type:complete
MTRQTNISEMKLKEQIKELEHEYNCLDAVLRVREEERDKAWEEIKELEKKLAHYEDNCTVVWMPEDVLSLDDTLTKEQVSWVLERMEHKHDASLGISWDTVEFWIDEVKSDDR